MTSTLIRKKLTDYIKIADEDKLKAIYTIVSDEINTNENDWNETFVSELDKRRKSFINGSAKTYTWEETKKAAVKKVQSKKK